MKTATNGGFIKLIILVIAVILVLSYFGISVRGIIESPTGQANLTYLGQALVYIWHQFLAPIFGVLYDKVILPFLLSRGS